MAIINNNWYLVYTKPKQECRASQNLINQGLKVFLPQLFITGRDKHKKNTIVEPMFPRYLFVWLNLEQDNWHSIRSTKGVSHLVIFGDHPAIIPKDVIKLLTTYCSEEGIVNQDQLSKKFNKGDLVYIDDGLLAGKEAIFLHQNNKKRVTLLLNLVHKATKIEISLDRLSPKINIEQLGP